MKYIAVFHYWWMDHKYWDVDVLDAVDNDDAHAQACVIKNDTESQFKHCAFTIIRIEDDEQIVGRKLTWWERLSGRLK